MVACHDIINMLGCVHSAEFDCPYSGLVTSASNAKCDAHLPGICMCAMWKMSRDVVMLQFSSM